MRKLLLVLLVLVVAVVALGFYLEWWGFSTSGDPETGQKGVKFSVDPNKIKSDVDKAKQKATGRTGQTKEQPQEK